jgi:hypothetical protein
MPNTPPTVPPAIAPVFEWLGGCDCGCITDVTAVVGEALEGLLVVAVATPPKMAFKAGLA